MYYPILRSKMGELGALMELSVEAKKNINPILQIIPDPKTSKKIKDFPDIYWDTLANRINKLEGVNTIYLDNTYLSDDVDSFVKLIERIDRNKLEIKPVLQANSTEEYIDFCVQNFPNSIFLRIKNEFAAPRLIYNAIQHYKERFSLDESAIDLLVDFGNINSYYLETITSSFGNIVQNTNNYENLNSVIISSGCFPVDVSDFQADTVSTIPRLEWQLHNSILDIDHQVFYSDYTNVNPEFNPYAPAFLGSCTLKYTGNNDYYIFRGVRPDYHPDGNGQYIEKCRTLVEMEIYSGRDYSAGDKYISDCANGDNGPGNAGTWVKVSQNHHFTKVLNQLNGL